MADDQIVMAHEAEAVSNKENFTWNKWETDNFIVLSIEKSHGIAIKKTLESIRKSHFEKWGANESEFSSKCKIICVPNPEILKRFFGIEKPRAEVRRDDSGKTAVCAVWFDFDRLSELPGLVASVSEEMTNNKFYVKRAIVLLSSSVQKIKEDLSRASYFDVGDLIACGQEKWSKMSPEERSLFDKNSALLCLMLRKEFGREYFSEFLRSPQDKSSIVSVYGFKDLDEFNGVLSRYIENLTKDISTGRVPDSYLLIRGANK